MNSSMKSAMPAGVIIWIILSKTAQLCRALAVGSSRVSPSASPTMEAKSRTGMPPPLESAHTRSWNSQQGQVEASTSAPMARASRQALLRDVARGGVGVADEGEHAAAAEALLAVVLHLHQLEAGDGLEHVARLLVDAAVGAPMWHESWKVTVWALRTVRLNSSLPSAALGRQLRDVLHLARRTPRRSRPRDSRRAPVQVSPQRGTRSRSSSRPALASLDVVLVVSSKTSHLPHLQEGTPQQASSLPR